MIGTKFYKPLETQEQLDEYSTAAEWCNSNNATIEDKGEFYEVVEIPAPSLEEVKTAKIAELKGIRDEKELEPVQYIDHLYDFDTKSFDRINAAIIALDQTHGTIGWTCADNQVVEVNADALRGVIASAAVRSNALHIIYRELKEAVNAATTVSEVESIVWPSEE